MGLAAKPLIEGPPASLWVVAASQIVGSRVRWAADRTPRRTAAGGIRLGRRHLASFG